MQAVRQYFLCLLLSGSAFLYSLVAQAGMVQLESGAIDYYEPPVMPSCPDGVQPTPQKAAAKELQAEAPSPLPKSIHQVEQEYYQQFGTLTDTQWDQVRQSLNPPARELQAKRGGGGGPSYTLEKQVFGWFPYWEGTDYTYFNYDLLSTIAYFSYEVDPTTGHATTTHSWSTTPLVDWAHSNNVNVVLCATIFSSHSTLLSSASSKSNLINDLIADVQARDAEGVNIDFEGASDSSLRNPLTAFMSNLTVRMHAEVPGSKVSICLPAVDWNSIFDVVAYNGFLDQCIIMGYDYSWGTDTQAGPVAPLKGSSTFSAYCVQKSVSNYLNLGLSPGKLLLGCPYYGYDWPTASYSMHANTTGSGTARMYPATVSYASTYGYNWDANSQTPYVLYGSYRQLWYDDTNSLGLKYDFVNDKGIAGIGIWALGYDDDLPDLWNLIGEKLASTSSAWASCTPGTAANFYGIAYGSNTYVAVGTTGMVFSTTDLAAWTHRNSGTSDLLLNVAFGGDRFVAVGDRGALVTSPNGAAWTVRTSDVTNMLRGVAWGSNKWVVVGNEGAVSSSANGSSWTAQSSGITTGLQGVVFGLNKFVAVGNYGVIITSPNGTSWTPRASGVSGWLLGVCYGNNTFVAVGTGGILVTSPDGITWSSRTSGTADQLYRVAFGNGTFVAAGVNGTIIRSTDGTNWTEDVSGSTNTLRGMTYGRGSFVAAGYTGAILSSGPGGPSLTITTGNTTVPNGTTSYDISGTSSNCDGLVWTDSLGGSGNGAASANWTLTISPLTVGTNLITVTGTNTDGDASSAQMQIIRSSEAGGGGGSQELMVTPAPEGALTNIVIYCSAGHGFYADTSAWYTGRTLGNGMVEDMGNIDQLNFFVQYCLNAGAAVVPMRPVGYQTNAVILDNDDAGVTFTGTWANSASTIFYGSPGDTPYKYAYINTTGQTAVARYTPNLPQRGYYPVYCWTLYSGNRVRQSYRIRHSGGINEIKVNHRRVGAGWVWLGNYYFEAGTNGYVEISNYAPGYANGVDVVVADAIRFGNGMGNIDRGFGVSGYEKELECSRYWVQDMTQQGMTNTLYDRPGLNDNSDNVGAPTRMADYMDNEADGNYWDRLYLGFHSNGYDGSDRGAMGLYNTNNTVAKQLEQQNWGRALNDEIETDLEFVDQGNGINDDWTDTTIDLLGGVYGEIDSDYNPNMNSTIIEVAYHDNADDAKLLKDPGARNYIARACYQAIVKYLSASNSSVPNVLLPDPPTAVRAINTDGADVTVSWTAAATNSASGNAATSYVVYQSTNGYGFGNPTETASTSVTLTNLTPGVSYFFRVGAVNAGGESLPSEAVGCRVSPMGRAFNLVVNGFDRFDRSLCPTRYFAANISGSVTMVRPLQINTFDYVIQHGKGIESAGRFYDSCSHVAVISNYVRLTNYHAAYWILGEESTSNKTFDSTEQTLVRNFMTNGGCFFASGSEVGWDLGYLGDANDGYFITNYLKSAFINDDAATNRATGKSGTIFDGIGTVRFDDGSGPTYNVDYPDVIASRGGSITSMVYGSSASGSSGAAIQYSNVFRVVFMGFPFETIIDESSRTNVMARVVKFFGDASEETPVLNITNTDATVANAVAIITIGGTNNAAVVGSLLWTNSLTAGSGGVLVAGSAFQVGGIGLNVGTNVITIKGTNALGASSSDSVTIIREPAAGGSSVIFADDFEDGDLVGWTEDIAGSWTNTTTGAITGSRSLKHNLSSVESTSYIYAQPIYSLAGTQTVWRLNLKNGNWDPSDQNRFWIYLMANDSNLGGSGVDGYAVGINLSGSTDMITLWRVLNGAADSAIITSSVDWGSVQTNGIEVTRNSSGQWELKVDSNGGFDSLVSAGTGSDTTYSDTSYFGLYFDFTSTRAGQVWLDDVSIWQTNSVSEDADSDGMPDWWEAQYFTNGIAATATGDDDRDGADNLSEWLAGTVPTNAGSVFAAGVALQTGVSGYIVNWPSATDRTYSVCWSTNLTAGFGDLSTNLAAYPPVNAYTDTVHYSLPGVYYHIRVKGP